MTARLGNVPPMALTAATARALREAIDEALDTMLTDVTAGLPAAHPRAIERDLVDAVRRWAARREEAMFPSARGDDFLEFARHVGPWAASAMAASEPQAPAADEDGWHAQLHGLDIERGAPASSGGRVCASCGKDGATWRGVSDYQGRIFPVLVCDSCFPRLRPTVAPPIGPFEDLIGEPAEEHVLYSFGDTPGSRADAYLCSCGDWDCQRGRLPEQPPPPPAPTKSCSCCGSSGFPGERWRDAGSRGRSAPICEACWERAAAR